MDEFNPFNEIQLKYSRFHSFIHFAFRQLNWNELISLLRLHRASHFVQFHSVFSLRIEMNWNWSPLSACAACSSLALISLIAVNSWRLAPIRFINIHWVEWNERIQGFITFRSTHSIHSVLFSFRYTHSITVLPLGSLSIPFSHWFPSFALTAHIVAPCRVALFNWFR